MDATAPDFDVDAFLAEPLTARVATNGPTVRPTWYLWEDFAFWILTGPWARLPARVRTDPGLAITVDVWDAMTGVTKQVVARGSAEVLAFDVPRGRRLLSRYLGSDEELWDPRFSAYLYSEPAELGTVWVRMAPTILRATDVSYQVSADRSET